MKDTFFRFELRTRFEINGRAGPNQGADAADLFYVVACQFAIAKVPLAPQTLPSYTTMAYALPGGSLSGMSHVQSWLAGSTFI